MAGGIFLNGQPMDKWWQEPSVGERAKAAMPNMPDVDVRGTAQKGANLVKGGLRLATGPVGVAAATLTHSKDVNAGEEAALANKALADTAPIQALQTNLPEGYNIPSGYEAPALPDWLQAKLKRDSYVASTDTSDPDAVRAMLPANADNTQGGYKFTDNGFDFTQPNSQDSRITGAGSMRFENPLTDKQKAAFMRTLDGITKLSPSQKLERAVNDAERARLARGKVRDEKKDELALKKMEAELAGVNGGVSPQAGQALKAVDRLVKDPKSQEAQLFRTMVESAVNNDPAYAGMSPQDAALMAIIQNETGGGPIEGVKSLGRQNPLERAGNALASPFTGLWNLFAPPSYDSTMSPFADVELESYDGSNYRLNLEALLEKYGLDPSLYSLLERSALSRPEE